ncbi:MAG TPA: ATP-binding cassette domain-containing protein [Gemmatimonadaceae bacterium]|nr:ATP-binding cassette domain-containing protein [Gemmatimonadaceae bacterium]
MRKSFAGHVAVRDLSLTVPHGAVYGLLGPNGAGKTTTIRMIMNVIIPDGGVITVLGHASTDSKVNNRVGYLPEERGLYRKMKVRSMLRFLAALKGMSRREADRRIDEWLDRLSLRTPDKDWGNAKVDELSRGMQQKVQFIGTMLHDPELVILDEPFSGLDPVNAQAMKDTVVDLRRRGHTVLFSTHLMDQAERMCDNVCIIAGGGKVLDGEMSDVKASHGSRTIALSVDGDAGDIGSVLRDPRLVTRADDHTRFYEIELHEDADPQDLLRRVLDAGVRVNRFELVQPSLHQIFLERVGARGVEESMS